jgi:quinoprotein glucose dehydrogenase
VGDADHRRPRAARPLIRAAARREATAKNALLRKQMSKKTMMMAAAAVVLAAAAQQAAQAAPARPRLPADQWPTYGQNPGSTDFSPLTQITPANVSRLKQAWVYHYGAGTHDVRDVGLDYRFEVQPLMIGGVLYISTPTHPRAPGLKSSVTALEPETGKVLWKYEAPRNIHGRGLAYWPGDATHGPRLYFAMDKGFLGALDIKTGKPAAGFGVNGEIDGYVGVASERVDPSRRDTFTIPNPVSVYKNLIISAARPGEAGPPGPRGDIRAWDAVTGKLVWSFHTVPQQGDAYYASYPNPAETLDRSGANVWSTMSVDPERGMVFAPLGDLNGRAEGPELFAASLVALDANTGKLKWFQQITHKDLWDWDLPVPPVLADIKKDGKSIPAVIQAGKHGLVFAFERDTGRPIHGLEERPTPRSDDPNDIAFPTQPFPSRPEPVARTAMRRDEIANITPEQHKYCTEFWDQNKIVNFGLYTRPMLGAATVNFPGSTGGPNWGLPSFNPQTGLYVVNVQNLGSYRPAGPPGRGFGVPVPGQAPRQPAPAPAAALPAVETTTAEQQQGPPAGAQERPAPRGGFQYTQSPDVTIPCVPTPWGELVGVDMFKGEIVWKAPLGNYEPLGEKGVDLGTRNLGGNMATAGGLIFIGATNDRRFRAFEAKTGKKLWEVELPASAHAAPMSFMGKDGKQYVVTAAGGGTSVGAPPMSDALVAFTLQ